MGCGGSRANAIIEPGYHESWTRETESTWLTNTDIETPLSAINSKGVDSSLKEKRMVNAGTQCGKQPLTTTGSNHQGRLRRSCNNQSTRDSKRRGSKEAGGAPSKDAVSNGGGGDTESRKDCSER